jgi:YggT family protein
LNPQVANLFILFLYLLIAAIVVRALLSWFPVNPQNQFVRLLYRVTEPLLEPVRRILPRTGMIDLSAMVVLFLLYLMVIAVQRASA